jgi:hypothetical protein
MVTTDAVSGPRCRQPLLSGLGRPKRLVAAPLAVTFLFFAHLLPVDWPSFASAAWPATPPPAYPPSPIIHGMTWHTASYKSAARGSDLWPTTWGPGGHIYTAWGDGHGFGHTDAGLGFARIEGPPERFRGINLWTRPRHQNGKSAGLLSVDGTLYAWINEQDGAWPHVDVALAWSADAGKTWRFATMFPKGAGQFKPTTFLNFGRDYAGARDGYVYVYGDNEGKGASLYVARVPQTHIATRAAYEFLRGLDASGTPLWTRNVRDRRPVFTDPFSGGSSALGHVVYNAGIKRYLLTTARGRSAGKLGVYDAPEPWGPWTTVASYERWLGMTAGPGSQLGVNFPTKWISADGLTLWAVFSVYGAGTDPYHDGFNLMQATLSLK